MSMQKNFSYRSVAVLFPLMLAACSAPSDSAHEAEASTVAAPEREDVIRLWSQDERYVEMLESKAEALAKRELGRMAAAELTYRNKAEFHVLEGLIFAPGTGSYMKLYRNFTGYTIRDIYRSESYLYPVAYEIEFDYSLLGTPVRSTSLPNAQQIAQADSEFSFVYEDSIVRRYRADRYGDYNGRLPALPPRPQFHKRTPTTNEPDAAMPNRLPPGGPAAGGMIPIPPGQQSLPPIGGQSF